MRQKSYASKKVESVEDWVEKLRMVVLGPLSLAQVPLLKRPKMLEVLPLPLHIFKRSYMAPTPIVSNISSVVFCPLAPTAHTHQMSDRARYAGYLAGTSN